MKVFGQDVTHNHWNTSQNCGKIPLYWLANFIGMVYENRQLKVPTQDEIFLFILTVL